MADMDAVARMNDLYRYQRHFYDITRRTFLFGRDALLGRMSLRREDRVLEVGCGTARNLLKLHERRSPLQLYGLDASSEMLETAQRKLARHGLASRIHLAHGLAEDLDAERLFGVSAFDAVFFSYSLSMIPDCTRSIDAALRALKAGGSLYVVDFYDQATLHPALQKPLKAWLGLFGVAHRPELYQHLGALAERGLGTMHIEPFAARYGMWVEFRRT
jgi:S-adenosylmethionine-diacylgycerolhomoserine-N-methlytransferase